MRQGAIIASLVLSVCTLAVCAEVDLPARVITTITAENSQPLYYWNVQNVANTAQVLTLFCRDCDGSKSDVPLIAVLRDTLGDQNAEHDRISYVWLLTYSRPSLGKQALAAVPFFYWRAGNGSPKANQRDLKPFMNVAVPEHTGLSAAGHDVLQWTMLDPLTVSVRASTRAYWSNEVDHERLHIGEAITYLRSAPVGDGRDQLTQTELNTVIARLELRQKLLGGFVNERRAAQLGEEAAIEQERVRARNWELLRQCADKTGLLFEPIDLAGAKGEYAVLWAPRERSAYSSGTSLGGVWKMLNIKDPYRAGLLGEPSTFYKRALDANGSLLPLGANGDRTMELAPLGVYSLNYPKEPLLVIDFRNKSELRRHELTQRAVNELTSGIIGLSHFTNWYYYAGADLYGFYVSRHGKAINQDARLDCYSQFRVALALDRSLDPQFRTAMQKRVDSLAVNPLEASPQTELKAAEARYGMLSKALSEGSRVANMLDKDRRQEIAQFGETGKQVTRDGFFHYTSFGLYTHRASNSADILPLLDSYRRVQFDLNLLEGLVIAGSSPEVTYESSRIKATVDELTSLLPGIQAQSVRARAEKALASLHGFSQDPELKNDFNVALDSLQHSNSEGPGIALAPSATVNGLP